MNRWRHRLAIRIEFLTTGSQVRLRNSTAKVLTVPLVLGALPQVKTQSKNPPATLSGRIPAAVEHFCSPLSLSPRLPRIPAGVLIHVLPSACLPASAVHARRHMRAIRGRLLFGPWARRPPPQF